MRKDKHRPKVVRISESILVAGAGSVSTFQQIEEGLRSHLISEKISREATCSEIKDRAQLIVHGVRKANLERVRSLHGEEYARNYAPSASMLMASYTCKDDIGNPEVFLVDGDADIERITTYQPIGSGITYAELILKDYYRTDMTVEEGKRLAYWTISDTEEVDRFVGSPILISVITENGIKDVEDAELEAMEEAYQIKKNTMKDIFRRWSNLSPKIIELLKED